MAEREATIASRVGLHARPAAIFAEAAGDLPVEVTIAAKGEPADEAMDAASILSLMSLGAKHGDVLSCALRAKVLKRLWTRWLRSSRPTTTLSN